MSRSLTLSKTVIVDLYDYKIEDLDKLVIPEKKFIGVCFPSYDYDEKKVDMARAIGEDFCEGYFEKNLTESILLELLVQDPDLAIKLATKNSALDNEEEEKINEIIIALRNMHIATVTLLYNIKTT